MDSSGKQQKTPSKDEKRSASKKEGKRSSSKHNKQTTDAAVVDDDEMSNSKSTLRDHKYRAQIKLEGVKNASTFEHAASHAGATGHLDEQSLKHFIKNCDIKVDNLTEEEVSFTVTGLEAPLANALRRIMIAEIPTMAIDKVDMWQNTSIIADENLAHRIGLVPIKVDPRLFEDAPEASANKTGEVEYNEFNSLRFRLHVVCTKKDPTMPTPLNINDPVEEEKVFNHSNVYSSDLKWVPIGNQAQRFKKDPPRSLHDDILIAKLRPGQEIEMDLICLKGTGKTHAKWSPVCTAFYKLKTDIRITDSITGADAEELKKMCPTVFDIKTKNGVATAFVKDADANFSYRECLRHEPFASKIDIGKWKDIHQFHVESLGIYTPAEIVTEALAKLKQKASYWLQVIKQNEEQGLMTQE